MFGYKKKKQKVTVPTIDTTQITVPTLAGVKSALLPAAADAKDRAKNKAADQAQAGRSFTSDEIMPRVADARDHVSDAKDAFIDETLPKIMGAVSTAMTAGAVAKSDTVQKIAKTAAVAKLADSDVAHRAADAALVLKGDAVVKRKKDKGGFLGGVFGAMGLLALAGGLAWYFNSKNAQKDDPWARPLADPYVPPTSGRDSSLPSGEATAATTAAGFTSTEAGTDEPTDRDDTITTSFGQVSEGTANSELIPPATTELGDDQLAGTNQGFGDTYRPQHDFGTTGTGYPTTGTTGTTGYDQGEHRSF